MNFEKLYYPVAYLVAGILAAALAGTKIIALLRLPFEVSGTTNFYLMLGAGSLVGLSLYLVLQKQDDFWKRIVLLGFLSLVLFFRQLG